MSWRRKVTWHRRPSRDRTFTPSRGVFDAAVTQFIKDGDTPDKVLAVFGEYLGFDPATTPIDDQYTIVQNYLWAMSCGCAM